MKCKDEKSKDKALGHCLVMLIIIYLSDSLCLEFLEYI